MEENLRHGFQKLSLSMQLLLLTSSLSSSPSCRGSIGLCRVGALNKGHKVPCRQNVLEAAGGLSLQLPSFLKFPVVDRNPSRDQVTTGMEKTCE